MQAPLSIYGLGLQVNVPLAGLRGLAPSDRVDIDLALGSMPPALLQPGAAPAASFYESEERDEAGTPAVRVSRLVDGAYYELAYSDGTRVVLDAQATRIWATSPEDATVEDTAAYLLGPTLGFALRLRGVTCLHASTVAFANRAVAFVGAAGAGKSTLAAAFAQRGHAVLTDDLAPLVDRGHRFDVQPAYPRIRLWPDSVEFLFGAPDALPRITPNWEKRFLGLDGRYRFAAEPLPLAAVYLLGERGTAGAPRIEALHPRQALMGLVPDTYTSRLLDREQRAREFELLGRLAASVPVRRLFAASDPARLDEMCDLVQRDVADAEARRP